MKKNIKIEKNGVLNNAKIHIENPNFKINEEKLDKTFVKAVDVENNDITLNQIVTGEKNIKIPHIQIDTFLNENEYQKIINKGCACSKYIII